MKSRRSVSVLVYLGAVVLLCLSSSAPAAAQLNGPGAGQLGSSFVGVEVEPDSFEFTVTCWEPIVDSLCVMTGGTTFIAADILFIMDVTGSMNQELAEVKQAAIQIMTDIEGLGIDAAYGVGSFCDYPRNYESCEPEYDGTYGAAGDYPWQMNLDVTTDTSQVSAAIKALTIHSGTDLPEDYARALYECQFFNFRENAKKIVIMIGDAPVHDCDFLPVPYGPDGQDPGRDTNLGTADDLDYQEVVGDLAAGGFTVLSLDSSEQDPISPLRFDHDETLDQFSVVNGQEGSFMLGGNGAWENFEYMAVETDGIHYLLQNAQEIPDKIVELVGQVAVIDWMSLEVSPEVPYADWLTVTPLGHTAVGPNATLWYKLDFITNHVPVGTYNFDLIVDGDGQGLATVPVEIDITGASAAERTTWGKLRTKFHTSRE